MGVVERLQRQIDDHGRVVQIRTKTNTNTGPDADFNPEYALVDVDATAIIGDFTAHETEKSSTIQADDKKALIGASAIISKQDKLLDEGIEYHIENIRKVQPGNNVFLYRAQLRA